MRFVHDLFCRAAEPFLRSEDGIQPFIENDGFARFSRTRCLLCCERIRDGSDDSVRLHCEGVQHKKNVEKLRVSLPYALNVVERSFALGSETLIREMAMLNQGGRAAWKDTVQADLYRFLSAPSCAHRIEEFNLTKRACEQVITSLQNERWVQLALAVWKAQCQRQMKLPTGAADFDYDSMHAWLDEWKAKGWKAHKQEQRDSAAMDIIVKAVQPFLAPP
jgi:hypothetical protein